MYHRILNLAFPHIIPKQVFRIIPLIIVLAASILPAQTRQELEVRRNKLEQDISSNASKLAGIKKDKSSKLEQYIGIKAQTERRKTLLDNYQLEVALLDSLLLLTQSSYDSLVVVDKKMTKQYALLLQSAYRMKANNSDWQFLFSASSFNEAYKRWLYLRQYQSAIRQQASLIKKARLRLGQQQQAIEEQRTTKSSLVLTQREHFLQAQKELQQTDQLIKTLDRDERRIAINITQQKKAFRQLNYAIESAIQREIAAQAKKSPQLNTVEKEKETIAATGFSGSKGKLPWPVSSGKIISSFGKQPHPKIKSVQIINNGIDIQTNKKAVKSIYEGAVVSTQIVPGYKNTVIIRHANYYSVYSNMETIEVRRNEQIAQGQVIGRLGGDGHLHFEIWRGKNRVNPVLWIR